MGLGSKVTDITSGFVLTELYTAQQSRAVAIVDLACETTTDGGPRDLAYSLTRSADG